MKIRVVILAGGVGSRMGGRKPQRLLSGKPLIDHAAALARQWSHIVAVAVRSEEQAEGCTLPRIFDEEGVEGPLAGLVAGLRFAAKAGCDRTLAIPADAPFLPHDLAERLSSAMGCTQAAIASSGGHLHPICGLWRTSALEKLPAYLGSSQRSLRGFAEAVGFKAVEWPIGEVDPFFNINTIEDLAEAERLIRLKNRAL